MTDQAKNIYQKLLAVRKTVEYLKKEASGYKYNYAKESRLIGALRPAMDSEGLFLEVEMLPPTLSPRRDTYRKEEFQAVAVDETKKTPDVLRREESVKEEMAMIGITFTWVNCDNPTERISKTMYFPCTNYDDPKFIGGLMTYGMRYFLLKTFQIATDDIDLDVFQAKQAETSTITPGEVDEIYDAIEGDDDIWKAVLKHCPGSVLTNLTRNRFQNVLKFIRDEKAKKAPKPE